MNTELMNNKDEISIIALRKMALRASFYEFFKWAWPIVVPSAALIDNWHIKYLCDELQIIGERIIKRLPKEYDLIINISPGESKSTIGTILFPVWLWINDPTIITISSSYSSTLSLKHSQLSKDVIKHEKFVELFPEVAIRKDIDSKHYYKNTLGGERIATSVGGTITGSHGHLILIDDPLKPEAAASKASLASCNYWLEQTLPSRKVEESITPTIMIMQRLGEDDPTGRRLEDSHIKHICLPASDEYEIQPRELVDNYTDGLMNPTRRSWDVLKGKKTLLGSRGFAAQYGQSPKPLDGNLFKKDWFEIVDYGIPHLSAADLAYTDKEYNDPSGMGCGEHKEDVLIICDYKEVYADGVGIFKAVIEFIEDNDLEKDPYYIENKGPGKTVTVQLKTNYGINAIEYKHEGKDKTSRAHQILPYCEAQRVKLKRGPWNKSFLESLLVFPNGKHDEALDVLVMLVNKTLAKPKRRKSRMKVF